jgi:DNA-directed RNA polymerase
VKEIANAVLGAIDQVSGEEVKLACGWMRDLSKRLAETGNPVRWITPSGFPVLLGNFGMESKTITVNDFDLEFDVKVRKLRPDGYQAFERLGEQTAALSVIKQKTDVTSAVIHSLDAAHMALTVAAMEREGHRHFCMIHDDFRVHASDVARLGELLRREFVAMHSKNLLADLLEQQRRNYPGVKLPEPPERGGFDIREVESSAYFFS